MHISGTTRLLGLIGTPVGHSKSPQMYNYCFQKFNQDFAYFAFDVTEENTEKAINIMKEAGFTVGRTAVVAVEVDDKPGGLNNILEALSGQNVNVEYMYAFVQEGGGSATMIFRFDRIDQAIEVLKAKNIPIIPADRING